MDEDQDINRELTDQAQCTAAVSEVTQPVMYSDKSKEIVAGFLPTTHKKSNLKCRSSEEVGVTKALPSGWRCSSSPVSEGSALDCDLSLSSGNYNRQLRADSPLQTLALGTHHSENSAAYFRWPPAYQLPEDRAAHFIGQQKVADEGTKERPHIGRKATTLLDLMTIRASNSRLLRQVSLGTAVGFRTRQGALTNIPAIIVFVAHKVHKEWLLESERLPTHLEGPGGVWCDVDVVEFAYYSTPIVFPKEQVYTELVEGFRGNDPCIGPGSQVANQEKSGTLGAIVQSKTGAHQVGFLTNRHVAVDLDYPSQKMYHPLPPNVGPGIYLGAVERATSYITDDRWYHIFASMNPETFVRADGAFIPFVDSFDMSRVTTTVKGVGDMGDVMAIDLQDPISSVVGRKVLKVGRSSGLTKGSIMAYALEYNDEKGVCFFTDFLIVGERMGEKQQAFDLEGDSGSLILMTGESGEKPRPVGIIWGGTANRGRLKLRNGHWPENWTSGVDLWRLLNVLQLDLITNDAALADAIVEQTRLGSTIGECSPRALGNDQLADAYQYPGFENCSEFILRNPTLHLAQEEEDIYPEELGRVETNHDLQFNRLSGPVDAPIEFMKELNFGIRAESTDHEHHQGMLALKKISSDDLSFGLNLSDRETKRRRH